MKGKLKKYFWYVLGLIALIFLFQKIHWLPDFSFLKSKPVTIDETPVIIKEIKNISQLIAIKIFDETSMDSVKQKDLPSFPGLRPDPDKIVIIAKGVVTAGMDMKEIQQENLKLSHDTVFVQLPPAKILEVVVNPSDYETFDEQGKWSEDAVKNIKIKLRDKILQRALSDQILDKASRRCNVVMENFLHSLGYKIVIFVLR